MKKDWTQGLDDSAVIEVRGEFKSIPLLRRRLRHILEGRIEENRRVAISKSLYENPNWAYRQADLAGFERCLREIIALFEDAE